MKIDLPLRSVASALAVLLVLNCAPAAAHSGRTNAEGCHAGTQPYHCHGGSRSSTSGSSGNGCHPAYEGACLRQGVGDYDCQGGSGNGPNYVRGPVYLPNPSNDPFRLDRDGDGVACER